MTLLEFAEKTSPTPLTAWQRDFLTKYEQAVKEGKQLICCFPPNSGRSMMKNIINQYQGKQVTEVYCQGTKKIGIPCRRYLGKVEGKAELLCPICKSINIIENGVVKLKKKEPVI